MKKPIAVFMCLVLLITSCIAAVSAIGTDEPTITCESITCKPGDQVEVSVTVSNNPGFMYLELTPVYSSELTLATVKNGELISDLTKGKQTMKNFRFASFMMMEMCMWICCIYMNFCVFVSDIFSISEVDHCAA